MADMVSVSYSSWHFSFFGFTCMYMYIAFPEQNDPQESHIIMIFLKRQVLKMLFVEKGALQ